MEIEFKKEINNLKKMVEEYGCDYEIGNNYLIINLKENEKRDFINDLIDYVGITNILNIRLI